MTSACTLPHSAWSHAGIAGYGRLVCPTGGRDAGDPAADAAPVPVDLRDEHHRAARLLHLAIGDLDLHVPHELVPASVGVVITLINIGFGSFGIGLNPARDLGPRLVAAFTGEFHLFEPGAWIYLIGPVFGAILGGYAYTTGSRYARSKLMVRRASADLRNQGVWGVVVPTEQSVRQSLEQSYPAPRPLSY